MFVDFVTRLNKTISSVRHGLPRGFSVRQALSFSVAMHIVVIGAIGALWPGNNVARFLASEDEIVFDLEIEPFDIKNQNDTITSSTEELGKSNPDAEKEVGRASNLLRGNMNRDALLRASLTDLVGMAGSFEFVGHTVVSDSTGGFSLIDGDVPGSEFDSFGRKKGKGLGRGNGSGIRVSGGGFCPVPGGYR